MRIGYGIRVVYERIMLVPRAREGAGSVFTPALTLSVAPKSSRYSAMLWLSLRLSDHKMICTR
jgi:hypothetical protein